jgi:hypothetical protein
VSAKVHFGAQIDRDLRARIAATVIGLQRHDPTLTQAGFTASALAAWCEQMEKRYNAGERWEIVPGHTPTPGRRVQPPTTGVVSHDG